MNSYLTQISGKQKITKIYYKSTGLMDVLVISRDALRSKEINEEKLFSARSNTFLIESLLSIFMSTESNQNK